jgi:DNA modification methylase
VRIIEGDARHVLAELRGNCVDLIVTSPPYADSRKDTYGGIAPDDYVDWFLPIGAHLLRVLKPSGTFILNIKERVVDGERHTYVLELIHALRAQGWLWTEEFVWHKRNSYPGKWPNRFRDGWERLLQFNKSRQFAMYQDAVRVPVGDWASTRLRTLSDTDRRRDTSAVGSGFGKTVSNWVGRELVYPNNVLHLATECGNKSHSAAFPEALPEWFIRLFTRPGDIVLDPFLGSGPTAVVAQRLQRQAIGIEVLPDYVDAVRGRLAKAQRPGPALAPRPSHHVARAA